MASRPRDVRSFVDCRQQCKLLLEQRFVIRERIAEQRKRFDVRASPGKQFRGSARDQIKRRELLLEANGILGAEDADRARQPHATGRGCNRARYDGRRGNGEVRAVVLGAAEHVDARYIGDSRGRDDCIDAPLRSRGAGCPGREIADV